MAKRVSSEIKDKIVEAIKNNGISVANAAKEFGVSTHTIYAWIGNGKVGADTLEIGKLRKENQQLKMIIAEIMLESGKGKKNR